MAIERTQIFLIATAALLPLLGLAALLWRRFYREDNANGVRRVLKNSALPIAANLLNKVIDFGFAVIALRFLGPTGNGDYALVVLIGGLYFLTISNWGLNDLTVREVAADPAQAPRLFSITLLLRCGIVLLLVPVAAALVAGYALVGNPLSSTTIIALALLMVHLFPAALAAACSASFQARERMEVPALVAVLTNVCKTLVGVLVLMITPDVGARVVGLAGVALAATAFNAVIFFVLQQRMLFRAQFVWEQATGLRMLREAFPLLLNGLLLAVFFRFDAIILRAVRDSATLGLYDAAYKLINMTQIVPPYFVAALFPLLARHAASDRPALERTYRHALNFLQLLAWPVAAATTVLAPELIQLVGGDQFLPGAALALQLLIWYLPLSYANGVSQYVLIALRRQHAITVAFALGAAFNLVLNLLLIPRYSYLAAALVTVATEVALFLPLLRVLRAEGAAPPLFALAWRPAIAAGAMGLLMWAAHMAAGWPAALAALPLYPLALWVLGAFGTEERAILRRALGR